MSNYSNAVRTYFKDRCIEEFSLLQSSFSKWSEDISSHGFFNCIPCMNEMISYYIDLIKKVTNEYSSYTSNAKSKVYIRRLIINRYKVYLLPFEELY